eukprot:CAMPEP_0197908140 /NCGR_PEP_ID=MMETSP1439-20131203/66213_1 /TAXON_ID=66791 /ORGANISM="Gonyaulax spinifera, Strain CCMP409" /LENGTH=633 /DNA_ID=CAMNT_0043529609 /DNA_START=31 /DNA_END=1932 /DNA_ORIENTATION=-
MKPRPGSSSSSSLGSNLKNNRRSNSRSFNGRSFKGYSGETPLTVTRGCTDCPCFIAFGAALGVLVFIIGSGTAGEEQGHFRCPFGHGDGDIMRFGELRDFEGNVCGEKGRGEYLYFCKVDETLDLAHHICVETCPMGNVTSTQCYVEKTNTFELTKDYATTDFAGLFCMPKDGTFNNQVDDMLRRSKFMEYMLKFSEAARARELLIASGFTALMLSFLYLCLLQHFTYCLMWVGFLVVILVPGLIGGYLIYASQNGGIDNGPFAEVDARYDLVIGAGCALLSLVFFCIACCKRESVNTAAGCLEKACECILGVPSLVLEPIFALIGKLIFFIPLLFGLLLLLSCGNVTDSVDLTKQTFFDFDHGLKALIVYYLFMMMWIMETCTAVSQFVVAYTVELWWFEDCRRTDRRGRAAWGVIHGYCIAIEHHLGTLFCGALVISMTRFIRMAVGLFSASADTSGNQVAAGSAKVCQCCTECFMRFFAFLTKNAYMDVAMNGSNFCSGGKHALEVLSTEGTAAAAMNGATAILQLAGLGGIAATGAFVTWELATEWSIFSDPGSEHYVEDPMYLAALSAAISFVVAMPFLHIFDIASDTILYCEAHEEICRRQDEEMTQRTGCMGAGGCSRFMLCSPQE